MWIILHMNNWHCKRQYAYSLSELSDDNTYTAKLTNGEIVKIPCVNLSYTESFEDKNKLLKRMRELRNV